MLVGTVARHLVRAPPGNRLRWIGVVSHYCTVRARCSSVCRVAVRAGTLVVGRERVPVVRLQPCNDRGLAARVVRPGTTASELGGGIRHVHCFVLLNK